MRSAVFGVIVILVFSMLACTSGTSNSSENTRPIPPAAQAANVNEASIYEVDAEDPYKIFNGTLLDFAPGQVINPKSARLRAGTLRTGEGNFEMYYLEGQDGEQLGYLLPDAADATRIGSIHVTSEQVVTERGLRVGNTYGELVQRLGKLEVHGSEVESRTYASDGTLQYRLDEPHSTYEVDAARVSPKAKVLEIVILK